MNATTTVSHYINKYFHIGIASQLSKFQIQKKYITVKGNTLYKIIGWRCIVMDVLIGICPSCGKPFKTEKEGGEVVECAELCANPAAMPTGERLRGDQATKVYTDGNMHEMTRSEYIKTHGIDPEPVMQAVNKWREDQVRKWLSSFKSEDEVNEWIRRLSAKAVK
jgi:hypothetical protein